MNINESTKRYLFGHLFQAKNITGSKPLRIIDINILSSDVTLYFVKGLKDSDTTYCVRECDLVPMRTADGKFYLQIDGRN